MDRRTFLTVAAAGLVAPALPTSAAAAPRARVRAVVWNAPHRLDRSGRARRAFLSRLVDEYGIEVLCGQEWADVDARTALPARWRAARPAAARSTIVAWGPSIRPRRTGWHRLHRAGDPAPRGITWAAFRISGVPLRVGSGHLPAFYSSRPAVRPAYDRQERAAAAWLAGGPYRVLGADVNGRIPGDRTQALARVGVWTPPRPTGPRGQQIDYAGAHRCGPWRPRLVALVRGPSDHAALVVDLVAG